MSDSSCFPTTRSQALALEYVKAQDLRGKTPTEIAELFDFAYSEILEYSKKGANGVQVFR